MDLRLYYFVTNDNEIVRSTARQHEKATLIGLQPDFLIWVEKLLKNYQAMEFQLRQKDIT